MTNGTRIYVGRLSFDVRERDIEKFFKSYGRIREILLKDGFAFVEFDDHRDAEDAVYELNGKDLLGERVNVEFARGPSRGRGGGRFGSTSSSRYDRYSSSSRRNGYADSRYGPPRNTEYRVIVENLSSRVSWQDLKDFMRQAGDVTYADAHKREKNMGIVDFASYSDMKAALDKLDGQDLQGRRIRLAEDKTRRRRSRSRSPRRSKSRSRSPASRSRSPSKSRSRSPSKSRSVSPRRERSLSKENDRGDSPMKSAGSRSSRSRSRSRSVSPRDNGKSEERSSPVGDDRRSTSRDRKSVSRSRSRSRSPMRSEDSRSRSRSRSATPDKDVDNEE